MKFITYKVLGGDSEYLGVNFDTDGNYLCATGAWEDAQKYSLNNMLNGLSFDDTKEYLKDHNLELTKEKLIGQSPPCEFCEVQEITFCEECELINGNI